MKNRYGRILSVAICMIITVLALCASPASAEEKSAGFLGKPFPDFSLTDSEGNSFALSDALKSHDAVLINFWATWCTPCRNEFPDLNEAYGKYRGRVAFIALSTDNKDTPEMIEAYRKENGIVFPMGADEGGKLYEYIGAISIPDTVIVDRFGNAVFFHSGALSGADALERVLDTFLGDGYTETAVLDRIPDDISTRAFPVSAARAICPDSGNYRKLLIWSSLSPTPITGYIVPEASVRLRIEIAAEDDAASMTYADMYRFKPVSVLSMLDPERGVFLYDQEMPDASDEIPYLPASLYRDVDDEEDEKEVKICLFRDEESVIRAIEGLNGLGEAEYRWEYADTDTEEKAENIPQAYIVHVIDQDGSPVRGVFVNFCTDTSCVPMESDESGTITFTGAPDVYHVQILVVPDGYSWDEGYEMYTPREYGEWVLRIRKD